MVLLSGMSSKIEMSAMDRRVTQSRGGNGNSIQAPVPRSFRRPSILHRDEDDNRTEAEQFPSSTNPPPLDNYTGGYTTAYRRSQDELLCQRVHGRSIASLELTKRLPMGRSNRRKREPPKPSVSQTTPLPSLKVTKKAVQAPVEHRKPSEAPRPSVSIRHTRSKSVAVPQKPLVPRTETNTKAPATVQAKSMAKSAAPTVSRPSVGSQPRDRIPPSTRQIHVSVSPKEDPSSTKSHKRKSSFFDPASSRNRQKRVKWGQDTVQVFDPPPSDATSYDSTSPLATNWWSDSDSDLDSEFGSEGEKDEEDEEQESLRGGHPKLAYGENCSSQKYYDDEEDNIPIDPLIMMPQLEEPLLRRTNHDWVKERRFQALGSRPALHQVNTDLLEQDLCPPSPNDPSFLESMAEMLKEESRKAGTSEGLTAILDAVREKTGQESISKVEQEIPMGEEKTNGGGDYVQGEQKVLENDIISDTPNASDVVIISLPQAKTPAHLQADPAIWNPHYRTDLSHHPDRVWPPQKGSVYCETCFRDDCIRWISIRDNITMLMHLLGGDHAVHDIEKAGAEAKKLPLHANYPSDVIGFVLLYTIAEQRLPTLEVDVQVEVNRILDTLRLDIGASLKTMNKLGQQCKGLLRGGRASGDEQTKDLAEIEQKLGLEIPSDAFLLRISEEIARAKWELKGDSHNSLARKDKDDRGGEFETNNTIFPCAYCSESNAAHSRTVRASTSTNNNKGKPWLKALMWAHKLDEGLAARLKAQDFLDVVSARHSMAVEVPGISFLVDGTGGSTRIVLVEVASVFDVVMSSKQPVYAKAG